MRLISLPKVTKDFQESTKESTKEMRRCMRKVFNLEQEVGFNQFVNRFLQVYQLKAMLLQHRRQHLEVDIHSRCLQFVWLENSLLLLLAYR